GGHVRYGLTRSLLYRTLNFKSPARSGAFFTFGSPMCDTQLKLMFDLDGVYSSGTARFLGAFGGKIGVRLIVARAQPIYRTMQFIKSMLAPNGNYELVSFDCPTGPIPSVFSRADNCAVR